MLNTKNNPNVPPPSSTESLLVIKLKCGLKSHWSILMIIDEDFSSLILDVSQQTEIINTV